VFEVVVHNLRTLTVGLCLKHLPARLKPARPHDLLTEVDLGLLVLHAAVLLFDVGVVGCVKVKGKVAAAAQSTCPLRVGRMDLEKVPLQVRFPTDPLADVVLCAKGTLQLGA
jgi:hypothetical protein